MDSWAWHCAIGPLALCREPCHRSFILQVTMFNETKNKTAMHEIEKKSPHSLTLFNFEITPAFFPLMEMSCNYYYYNCFCRPEIILIEMFFKVRSTLGTKRASLSSLVR